MKPLPMQVSKWLEVPALLDVDELQNLRASLPPFKIFYNGMVVDKGCEEISWDSFLQVYTDYIRDLKEGKLPTEAACRPFFSAVWTADEKAMLISETPAGQVIPRPWQPVIQLQLHRFSISAVDGKVRSMVFGQDTIYWGIQWSFPQLYLEPENREVIKLTQNDINGNFALFKELQRWMRHHTEPAIFEINGNQVATPIRVGVRCKEWVSRHPQLKSVHS